MRVCELTHLSCLLTAGKTGPDWRQAFTCTVVLRLLISFSPKITALFAQGLSSEASGYPTSPRRNLKPPPPTPLSPRSHFTRCPSCRGARPDSPPPSLCVSACKFKQITGDGLTLRRKQRETVIAGFWPCLFNQRTQNSCFFSGMCFFFSHHNIFWKIMAPKQHLFVWNARNVQT